MLLEPKPLVNTGTAGGERTRDVESISKERACRDGGPPSGDTAAGGERRSEPWPLRRRRRIRTTSNLSDDKRAALERLRRAIAAAAPRAEECISYGIPAFRLDGRVLVFFAAATHHCSFFPGAYPIEALKDELTAYRSSKGTIRFDPARPLPVGLVRKLVKARIAEQVRAAEARRQAKRRKER